MKKLLFALILFSSVLFAQTIPDQTRHPEYSAINEVLDGYVEAIYQVDSTLVGKLTTSSLQKSGFYFSKRTETWSYSSMTYLELQHTAATYNSKGWISENAPKEIEVYHIGEKIASAKVTAIWGYDYVLLSKQTDGAWKMDKILWQSFTPSDIMELQVKNAYAQADETKLVEIEIAGESQIFKGCFDGENRFYFTLKKKGAPYTIYRAENRNGKWRNVTAVNLGKQVASNLYPVISPEGQYLVFTSYRPAPVGYPENAYFWMSKRTNNGWGEPIFLENLNQPGRYHSNPSFDLDGDLIYRIEDQKADSNCTYVAHFDEGEFNASQPYEPVERWKGALQGVYIWGGVPGPIANSVIIDLSRLSIDGQKLPSDQYLCIQKEGKWGPLMSIGKGVNTAKAWESFVMYSANRDTLYFIRDFKQVYVLPAVNLIS